ncbi:hypothetical protein [Actinomyces wuliandei]|uniref:hypothetical protein n=1 Tax=Actinomyces wuliandei TaxID=2057743 RepID=UPI000FDA9075|nr:hypothetical protein [Actinomyces wuliandei]
MRTSGVVGRWRHGGSDQAPAVLRVVVGATMPRLLQGVQAGAGARRRPQGRLRRRLWSRCREGPGAPGILRSRQK